MIFTDRKDWKSLPIHHRREFLQNDRQFYYQRTRDLLEQFSWKTCLELGPFILPILKDGDLMDLKQFSKKYKINYLHDATSIPWPIKNKKYDIFIALQVWEHLKEKQQDVFKEVIRISKNAILSFPYKWSPDIKFRPATPNHANINKKIIKKWTLGVKPSRIETVKCWTRSTHKRKTRRDRIIYVFRFS